MNVHVPLEDLATRVRPRIASNILLWVIVGFVVAFIAWAALTELNRTVRAQGRVVPTSQLQVVSNLEGGVVEEIFARAGAVVQAGQPLIRLDPTTAGSELGSSTASVDALTIRVARLQAEMASTSPRYPAATTAQTADLIAIERSLHSARQANLASMDAAGRARIAGAQRAVAEAEAAYQARVSARDARRFELDMMRSLVERGIEPRLSLMQAESGYAIAASEAAQAAQAIARSRASVTEAQASLAQAQGDWRTAAANELAASQSELTARRRAMPALAERAERTVLRAPVPGRVNRVLVTTRGGTVQPGQPLVEIVPSQDTLLIEAKVRPQDIGSVAIGQEARIALTAYDRAVHGTLRGKVASISPDTVVDERSGETFYLVQVQTDATGLKGADGTVLPIGAGMVAEVDLLGEERTILQYILSPLTRFRETAFRE
jgi:adhesin transport system membrane fusion protein